MEMHCCVFQPNLYNLPYRTYLVRHISTFAFSVASAVSSVKCDAVDQLVTRRQLRVSSIPICIPAGWNRASKLRYSGLDDVAGNIVSRILKLRMYPTETRPKAKNLITKSATIVIVVNSLELKPQKNNSDIWTASKLLALCL